MLSPAGAPWQRGMPDWGTGALTFAADEAGRRFESLRALTNAAAIRNGVDLRNEAVACLALTDLEPVPGWPRRIGSGEKFNIDLPRNRYLRTDKNGAITVTTDGTTVTAQPFRDSR